VRVKKLQPEVGVQAEEIDDELTERLPVVRPRKIQPRVGVQPEKERL